MSISRIIVVDHNPPWVRHMLVAMGGQGVEIWGIRPYQRAIYQSTKILYGLGRWSPLAPHFYQRTVLLPGWNRFPKLSALLMAHSIRRAIRKFKPQAIVYTLPQYAPVAEAIRGPLCVYFAHDPFLFYAWDSKATAALETRMLDRCDAAFAVAESLSEDFRRQSRRPVFTSRNAVSQAFVDRLRQPLPVPADLTAVPRPIVGCTGQINGSYDWDLIAQIAASLPQVSFVFVGPIFNEPDPIRAKIASVLHRPNVHWLGLKPHEQLPEYLSAFDICFNPLLLNDHNDRRSPLRLYDYLATNKPVLSTAIREASFHDGLVETFRTADQAVALIRSMLSPQYRCDLAARATYLRNNTWDARAEQFLAHLRSLEPAGSGT